MNSFSQNNKTNLHNICLFILPNFLDKIFFYLYIYVSNYFLKWIEELNRRTIKLAKDSERLLIYYLQKLIKLLIIF